MGVDFYAGKPQRTWQEDIELLEKARLNDSSREALERIKNLLEAEVYTPEYALVDGGRAHFSYGGFHSYRVAIAECEGIKLEQMQGFTKEPQIWWDEVGTPLKPLLYHSDCDGTMTPEECQEVLPRLREIHDEETDNETIQWGNDLVELMGYCAENDAHLVFA